MSEISIVEKIADRAWLEGVNLEPEDPSTMQAWADQRKSVIKEGRELMSFLGIEVKEAVRKPAHGGEGFSSLSGHEPIILRGSEWKELKNGERGENFEPIFARLSEITEQGIGGACISLRVEKLTGSQAEEELPRRYGMFSGIAGQIFTYRPALEAAWSGFVSDAEEPCMYRTELLTGRLLGDTVGDLEALAGDMYDIARSEVSPSFALGGLEVPAAT